MEEDNCDSVLDTSNCESQLDEEKCEPKTSIPTNVKCAIIVQFLQWSAHIRHCFELYFYIRNVDGKKIAEHKAIRADMCVVFGNLGFGVYEVFAETRYNIYKIGDASLCETNNVAFLEFIY